MSRKTRASSTTKRFYPSAPRDVFKRNTTFSQSAIASALDFASFDEVERALWSPSSTSIRSISPEIEDRRTWAPDRGPVSTRSSRRSRIPLQAFTPLYSRNFDVPAHVAFKAPRYVAVCVRRRNRREVLLAKNQGGGGHRRPKRNALSDIRC